MVVDNVVENDEFFIIRELRLEFLIKVVYIDALAAVYVENGVAGTRTETGVAVVDNTVRIIMLGRYFVYATTET